MGMGEGHWEDGRWVEGPPAEEREEEFEAVESTATPEIQFLNGNRNTPAIFLGDDPSNEANETDNVLVVPLGSAISVPRTGVSATEGTPEAEEG